MLKFAHIADCHLGAWRQPELQMLSVKAFSQALDYCIKEKVDFVLIAGDLFDNAIPSIDVLKDATSKLKELKEKNIPCYIIPGSHDFSVSGKTFLDVLENAGLFVNVARYEEDETSVKLNVHNGKGVCFAGIPGKKAGLEKNVIEKIKHNHESGESNGKDDLKILCLHTTITEAKPRGMEFAPSVDAGKLPAGFDYYAMGHLHEFFSERINGRTVVYPGPLFPANFLEFEELKAGSFCIVQWDGKAKIERKVIATKEVLAIEIDANNKTPEQIIQEAIQKTGKIENKIITLRVKGMLLRGKTSDVDFKKIAEEAEKNNNILLKNTSALESPEFKMDVESKGRDINEIEKEIIEKHGKNEELKEYFEFFKRIEPLMNSLDIEKMEGETNVTFEKRVIDETNKVMEII